MFKTSVETTFKKLFSNVEKYIYFLRDPTLQTNQNIFEISSSYFCFQPPAPPPTIPPRPSTSRVMPFCVFNFFEVSNVTILGRRLARSLSRCALSTSAEIAKRRKLNAE